MTNENAAFKNLIRSKDEISKIHDEISDADFGRALETKRLGIHWVELPPNQRSSNPHAESLEEEFIFVVSGRPHVWINGFIYELEPGCFVGFPAGTGIAHTFINNSSENVSMIVLGDRTKKENKCSFPINPELKGKHKDIWWDNYPTQEIGPHDGTIGNLQHQKNWQDLPFIRNTSILERKIGFSYPTDSEKFTEGVRLTDLVGLKSLGVWHEVMRPGKRSSWPHAHKVEEEAAVLLKGTAKVWLNGYVYEMLPGDCVFFKPGTGIAHVILNDSSSDVEFLGIGQADGGRPEDKVFYPLHQTRNEQCIAEGYFWSDSPKLEAFGNHLGLPVQRDLKIEFSRNAEDFLEESIGFLGLREAEYSLLIGLSELRKKTNKNPDDYRFATVYKKEELIGGFCVSEKNLVLSGFEEPVLKNIADFLFDKKIKFPGVVGPALTSEAFARIWSHVSSGSYKLGMGQKINKLEAVTMPSGDSGKLVLAAEKDKELVGQWLYEFSVESLPHEPTTLQKMTEHALAKIQKQEAYFWVNSDNTPLSMNLIGRPTRNGISVSGVYTPVRLRRKGYASALVAHTSQRMLDLGKKFCVLYTDVANPTSNKIYQQVGYKEIATSKHFVFCEKS
jgi:uncharacterized cupin superfamily protein